jgi:hypothetical protein
MASHTGMEAWCFRSGSGGSCPILCLRFSDLGLVVTQHRQEAFFLYGSILFSLNAMIRSSPAYSRKKVMHVWFYIFFFAFYCIIFMISKYVDIVLFLSSYFKFCSLHL